MKAQRITSAKFIWVRAPMISAPMMREQDQRVHRQGREACEEPHQHFKIEAALGQGQGSGFGQPCSASQRRADDDEHGKAVDGQEDRPFHPDGFALVFDQFRPQVQDGDPQAIDGVEQRAEENEDLEEPVLVDRVDEIRRPRRLRKRGQDVHRDENRHAQAADAVQDEGQHRPLALVAQGRSPG